MLPADLQIVWYIIQLRHCIVVLLQDIYSSTIFLSSQFAAYRKVLAHWITMCVETYTLSNITVCNKVLWIIHLSSESTQTNCMAIIDQCMTYVLKHTTNLCIDLIRATGLPYCSALTNLAVYIYSWSMLDVKFIHRFYL